MISGGPDGFRFSSVSTKTVPGRLFGQTQDEIESRTNSAANSLPVPSEYYPPFRCPDETRNDASMFPGSLFVLVVFCRNVEFVTPREKRRFHILIPATDDHGSTMTGGIAVSRRALSNASSMTDGEGLIGGYTWAITFPVSAGDAPELGVDGAALDGSGAAGNLVEIQAAHTPEVQRVSTSAGSSIWGYFTLGFNGETTEGLQFNATAKEVRGSHQLFPGNAACGDG